jgi:VanZ family protein
MIASIDYPIIEKTNDKIAHIMVFYLLAFLADFSFPDRGFDRHKVIPIVAYALLMETIQYFLSYRTFSVFDLAANGAGLLIYRLSIPTLRYVPLLRQRWNESDPAIIEP